MKLHIENRYINNYLSSVREQIKENKRRVKEGEGKLRRYSNSQRALYDESWDLDDSLVYLYEEANALEQTMWRTAVIIMFSFLERQLCFFCNDLQKKYRQSISYKDIAGQDGIGKALKYTHRVLGEKFPKDKILRDQLDVARSVRNAIIHGNAELKEESDEKRLDKFIRSHRGLLEVEDKNVAISPAYIESLVRLNSALRDEIFKELGIAPGKG